MDRESIEKIRKGIIITSGIFPEKVEVITAEEAGTNCTVLVRGLETGQIYEKILTSEQLDELEASLSEAGSKKRNPEKPLTSTASYFHIVEEKL